MVSAQIERLHVSIGYLDAFAVAGSVELRCDAQASGGRSAADEAKHVREAAQRMTGPVAADLGKQPVFDGIPLGRPAGIVAHHDRQTGLVGQLLQFVFP